MPTRYVHKSCLILRISWTHLFTGTAGGGPFYVPAMNVGLGFDLKLCTGLSHSIVAAGAIGSVLYGLVQPSPLDGSRPLLNFDIALTLIPAMLFGVSFGARPHNSRFQGGNHGCRGRPWYIVARHRY